MENPKLKILLADDQALFADSLCTFLNNYADDMEVVGIARNGKEAVSMAAQFRPDIILMDVRMPVMDGVEATRIIRKNHPDIKIIMLSTYHEDEFVRSSLLSGASGYLLKDISPTELITAVRALKGGIMQISPDIVQQLIHEKYSAPAGNTPEAFPGEEQFEWLETLTNREREIFILIATGYSNEEIAEKLNLNLQTVMNQVSTIYSKLEVKDRFEIIRKANRRPGT
ncbi:response regulator transcription factor [Breznakiella homolactica]|uniref:Response regulator transcription factor n=1 Tax=Breznakiella homolactica TaxID=2798577 RepID=A0A7T8BBE5_9SPIR|nr:response regulator transcription factor [Breznakiella homolactica]QQO09950.1 response regulator transcription factor [Breznakiella homolactica]